MKPSLTTLLITAALIATPWATVQAQSRAQSGALEERLQQLEARLERLERLLEGEALMEMMQRVDAMDQDVRELRGESEQLRHEFEGVRHRQRELYLDVDSRLERLERSQASLPATPAPIPGTAPPARPDPAPPATPATSAAPADSTSEQAIYQAAFDQLRQGRYQQAVTGFRQVLEQFPDGRLAANAQYWIAEAYYVTRDFPRALEEFKRVNQRYPGSNKQLDALLKQGFTHYELEQWTQARSVLTQVRDQDPGSSVARLAEQRLRRMDEAGRP
ncbi:tol-pal system protein YbgF [Ectothiorhodospira magna]|uniref:Cell division coordinator CpoB n=1 Tax=Ectothiorhodospira magna TaxID=867345 RepID=A0A1H8ZBF7_9GAMM|nr:tol-pal system protein YbgF [Ectothiorhodospira magna]SEP61713.1 tol-pal system protein YbgF [Ectothiorhodospira magna]